MKISNYRQKREQQFLFLSNVKLESPSKPSMISTNKPEDIAAECWLEAANALQLPVAELAMDFEVHSSLEGHWLANYRACPQSLVKAYVAQLNALDLQPDAITCSSQMNELGQAWGLQPGVMAEAFRLPCTDELASHYFNLFKEDTPC